MPPLTGLLESALYVDDLERASRFYHDLFGFEEVSGGERLRALSIGRQQVLLLFKKGGTDDTDGDGRLHLAFAIPANALADWERRLAEFKITIESRRTWDRGGSSIYFRDPDGHLLELATPGVWSVY
jgi:catechol 2,3-dioxygenase-like lactoylglutathione lyase family enzyme